MMKDSLRNREEILAFIGAGRLGRALSLCFHRRNFTISSVIDVNLRKASRCQEECHARAASRNVRRIPPETTVLFITVPDDEIEKIGLALAGSGILQPGMVVAHTSGLLPSDVLSSARKEGILVCSFHPCFSFTEDFEGDLKDAFIALEGDSEGCQRLERLAESIGGKPFSISKEDKILYHTGCVMASNYLVSLMDLVHRVLGKIDKDEGLSRVMPLVRETLRNIEKVGVEKALTGPVLRGDIGTVEKHLKALMNLDPTMIPPYIALGRTALRMAEILGSESDKIRSMEDLFETYDRREQ